MRTHEGLPSLVRFFSSRYKSCSPPHIVTQSYLVSAEYHPYSTHATPYGDKQNPYFSPVFASSDPD